MNNNREKNTKYITSGELRKLLGVSKQTLHYKIKMDLNGISKFLKVVKKTFKNNKTIKTYLFKTEILKELEKHGVSSPKEEEMDTFRSLYYKLISCYEEKLDDSDSSIRKGHLLWLDMPIIDIELCGDIYRHYKEKNKKTIPSSVKKDVLCGIENHIFIRKDTLVLVVETIEKLLEENCKHGKGI